MENDDIKVKKGKTIHYGSLEEKERQRLAGVAAGIIEPKLVGNVSVAKPQLMDVDDSRANREVQMQIDAVEFKRKARQIKVSVDDVEVRAHLRDLNEPMCMYSFESRLVY